jgi:hypothetical protein
MRRQRPRGLGDVRQDERSEREAGDRDGSTANPFQRDFSLGGRARSIVANIGSLLFVPVLAARAGCDVTIS